MYRTSTDLRFAKNREALRRAYIDLVKEKSTGSIAVKELAARANVNRMTFYSHYDTVSDILAEYVDDMTAAIIAGGSESGKTSVAALLEAATSQMEREIDFFRLVARENGFEQFRAKFRYAFRQIFSEKLQTAAGLEGESLTITADMVASGVTYAYLDWLAGEYGDLPLQDMLSHFEEIIERLLPA